MPPSTPCPNSPAVSEQPADGREPASAAAGGESVRPWVAIQRNRRSGSGEHNRELHHLLTDLRHAGFRPRLFSRRERLDAMLASPASRAGLKAIVAAGGDGTVRDLVNRHPGVPLAILPLGTENLLARYLEIPRCGASVAQMIIQGCSCTLDVCRLTGAGAAVESSGSLFIIMLSCGFDAEVIRLTHSRRRGNITRLSYLQPIWQALRMYRYPQLRISADGVDQPLAGHLAVVANLPVYALNLPVAGTASGTDGVLDLRVFRRPSSLQLLRYLYHVLLRRHESLEDVGSFRATRFQIQSDIPVPVQVDGDPCGTTPVDIDVLPQALQVFCPPAGPRSNRAEAGSRVVASAAAAGLHPSG